MIRKPAKPKPRKPRPCKSCREPFVPKRPLQVTCDTIACAVAYAQAKRMKRERAETRAAKRKMLETDAKHWKKKAKAACHKYIRERDRFLPCISCGTTKTAQWDAGHFRASFQNSALRYHELNIHKQCCTCNDGNKLSGNVTNYRIGLVKKIGQDAVEWLEGPHPSKRWTVDELKQVTAYYMGQLRELEQQRERKQPAASVDMPASCG